MNNQTIRHAYSEFLGTFALVFVGSGAIMTAVMDNGTLLSVAIAHGLVLGVFCSAFMRIAAHFNPAVTIGFLFTRRITPSLAVVHIVAQFAGAIVAAFALKALYPEAPFLETHGGGQSITTEIGGLQPWALEAAGTFFLMTVIYGTAVDKRSPSVGGFGIGLSLAAVILAIGPLTGASLNPARTWGPAIASGVYEALGIYTLAPIIGAVAAALAYEHLILKRDDAQSG
ncbi:MAG TPA: aquaporin [Gemmatimonadaceae bacterium]|nr:aquaporin [Gemmatimonadaceae bacterium]